MPQIPFRYKKHHIEEIENIPGSTRNGKLIYLVENYASWQQELQNLKQENAELRRLTREMKQLLFNHLNAQKSIHQFMTTNFSDK